METYAFLSAMSKPMNNFRICNYILIAAAAATLAAQLMCAQSDNHVTVPLSDPTRPVTLRAHLLNGSITVKGADVKEVIIDAKARGGSGEDSGRNGRAEGMKHIPMTSTGLNIEAENNQVRVSTDAIQRTVDLTITVPVHTSVSLQTVNDGNIVVSGIDGELDVNDVNGEVDLKNIAGSAVAHALNGHVVVTFNRIDPGKSMAFSSLNGDIDVTFPPDLKANVSMRTDNGEVYSDFDIKLQPN